MVCSQVRPLTSIYGVNVKSTAKFSYSAPQKISALDYCIKREKHSKWTEDFGNWPKDLFDYTDFVILAEAVVVGDSEACINNTYWYSQDYDDHFFTVILKDILPRNETCHAEILFINDKNFITEKIRNDEIEHGGQFSGSDHVDRSAVIRILEEKQKLLKEFENRWAKDVTFVVNGEKCAGDRQYLSAISPVFKKMLQDHAQDEITLEGVESADVLKDFFLAVSPLRVQPNPTNVVSLLKLARDYDIPFLMRRCEEHLKHCYEMSIADRFLLALKYELSSLKLSTEKNLSSDDWIKILGELNDLEQKREVLDRVSNERLGEILKKKKEILSEMGTEFLLENIAERLKNA